MASFTPDPGRDEGPSFEPAWEQAPCMLVRLDANDRVVAVNDWFVAGTSQPPANVHGRRFWDELLAVGSRVFYQTQLAPILELNGRLEEVMVDLLTADGGRVPALMNAVRHVDPSGQPTGTRIALMGVADRRAFEDRLRRARDEADRARQEAEAARRDAEQAHQDVEAARAKTAAALDAEAHARLRLELLAQVNSALASSLDIDVALQLLARVLATRLADWALIYVYDAELPEPRWSAAHAAPDLQTDIERLAGLLPGDTASHSALGTILDLTVPRLLSPVAEDGTTPDAAQAEIRMLTSAVGAASVIVVPVVARGAHVASIVLGRSAHRDAFTVDDLADQIDVAARTGIVIDNLRRQAREHSNSVALQHALLTTPPHAAGAQIARRYLPAAAGNEVGGDWYDALLQPDGTLVVVIGDVVGHDILAAAAMGQLRGIIRTLAYTGNRTPADILAQADRTARGLGVDVLATVLVARVVIESDGAATVQWSSAGHPPPLLMHSTGCRVLATRPDRLLGLPVALHRERHDHVDQLLPGDSLVLYTDGLVERRDEDLDESIRRLADAMPAGPFTDPESVCDHVLASRHEGQSDDVALLAVRIADTPQRG